MGGMAYYPVCDMAAAGRAGALSAFVAGAFCGVTQGKSTVFYILLQFVAATGQKNILPGGKNRLAWQKLNLSAKGAARCRAV